MSVDELTTWYEQIEAKFREFGFVVRTNGSRQHELVHMGSEMEEKYWLKIREFRLFPPRRNNLIVAVMDASPLLHSLYGELREIAKASSCQALSDVVNYSKAAWVPHITLANVKGQITHNEYACLSELLDDMNQSLNNSSQKVHPICVNMGGPIPEAAEFDWNFYPFLVTSFEDETTSS